MDEDLIYTLLPDGTADFEEEAEEEAVATKTYCLDLEKGRIGGVIDGTTALKQRILKGLLTDSGVYPIYSDGYGFSFYDLIGMDSDVVESEVERRLEESFADDSEIAGLQDIEFDRDGDELSFRFTVTLTSGTENTIEGSIAYL